MAEDSNQHRQAALRHEQAASNHDRSAAFWERHGKHEHAGLQRELAEYARQGAELELRWAKMMDPEPVDRAVSEAESARGVTQKSAEHLSVVLNQMAEALDQAAAVAERHAQSRDQAERREAADERRAADRARECARRARSHAEEWRRIAAGAEDRTRRGNP